MKEPLLKLEGLSIGLLEKERLLPAVRDVSLQLLPGGCTGIIGESGCGKSLTCQSVLGLLGQEKWQVQGRLFFDGAEFSLADRRGLAPLRGRQIGLIPQNPMAVLDPRMTILAHFCEGLPRHQRAKRREEAIRLLARMQLSRPEEILTSYPFQLSGGMLQRILIGLAVLDHPRLLAADEPTTALDSTVQYEIVGLLKELKREAGISLLLVSHDLEVIAALADRILVMYAGQVIEEGERDELLAHPLHPYTRLLFAARPSYSKERLKAMEGRPPRVGELFGEGCAFAPRCPFASAECRSGAQPLLERRPGHKTRCAREAGEGEKT